MKISDAISYLENLAHPSLQESYDNAGLLTGNADWECTGIIVTLDVTEDVVNEAVSKKCNLIVAHHPIIFKGLKKINGKNYVERTIIAAIKNDVAIYAIHTNLDNIIGGVSGRMADRLGLKKVSILAPRPGGLKKLFTFIPVDHVEAVKDALFAVGAGHIGNYSECGFETTGTGSFKANDEATPFVGKINERHNEREMKIEMIFPAHLESQLVKKLREVHPYEEPAFDIIQLDNSHPGQGSGVVGELEKAMSTEQFLLLVKESFQLEVIRHTPFRTKEIRRVALCGGAGSFLISNALASGADAYITGDVKYHEFFDENGKMAILDIGHYESEQYTIDLLRERLAEKFPTFAVLKTSVNTNPVRYYGFHGTKGNVG